MRATLFDALVNILRAECGEDVALRIVLHIRQEFGGERIYVPARQEVEVSPRDTPNTIREKNRVSRSTAYRLANKFRI